MEEGLTGTICKLWPCCLDQKDPQRMPLKSFCIKFITKMQTREVPEVGKVEILTKRPKIPHFGRGRVSRFPLELAKVVGEPNYLLGLKPKGVGLGCGHMDFAWAVLNNFKKNFNCKR